MLCTKLVGILLAATTEVSIDPPPVQLDVTMASQETLCHTLQFTQQHPADS